jgi:hypothetical protein
MGQLIELPSCVAEITPSINELKRPLALANTSLMRQPCEDHSLTMTSDR